MTRVYQELTLTPLDKGYRSPFVPLAGLAQTCIASQHTRQQRRPRWGCIVGGFQKGDFPLFFIETSNCCWLLNMLLLLVNYKSQIGLFNDFHLPCRWTTIQEVAVLCVIQQLSNKGSLFFHHWNSVHKGYWLAWVLSRRAVTAQDQGSLDGVETLRQLELGPPTYWLGGSPFLCVFCDMRTYNILLSEHGIICMWMWINNQKMPYNNQVTWTESNLEDCSTWNKIDTYSLWNPPPPYSYQEWMGCGWLGGCCEDQIK